MSRDQRAAILAAASRHFLGAGFCATTMSSIAADVGGSKGKLWQYFSSKDELFGACVDAVTERLQYDALSQLLAPGDPLCALRSFVEAVIDALRSDDGIRLQRVVGSQVFRLPHTAAMLHQRLVAVLEKPLSKFFAEHMTNGALREQDPEEAAWLTLALCFGFDHRRLLLRDEKLSDQEVAACADKMMSVLHRLYDC